MKFVTHLAPFSETNQLQRRNARYIRDKTSKKSDDGVFDTSIHTVELQHLLQSDSLKLLTVSYEYDGSTCISRFALRSMRNQKIWYRRFAPSKVSGPGTAPSRAAIIQYSYDATCASTVNCTQNIKHQFGKKTHVAGPQTFCPSLFEAEVCSAGKSFGVLASVTVLR